MTEEEWLASNSPQGMLEFILFKATRRKLRLFVCACCWRHWPRLPPSAQKAVTTAVAYADDQISRRDLKLRGEQFFLEYGQEAGWARGRLAGIAAAKAAMMCTLDDSSWDWLAIDIAMWASVSVGEDGATNVEQLDLIPGEFSLDPSENQSQVDLVRDIFGNPFRPVTVDETWRVSTVTKLACAIYDERAFDRMPILADALEEAGCDDATILDHCRKPGEHVRGCWLVDLLLGKK